MTFLMNLVAYSGQLLVLVAIGATLPWLLRMTAPSVRHAYWRFLLAFCLLLPWLQGRQPFASASSASIELLGASSGAVSVVAASPYRWDWTLIALGIFVAGGLARATILTLGLMRLRRLRHAGDIAPECDEHLEVQHNLGTRAEIRYVAGLGQPVTFGLLRPVVLLPKELRSQPPEFERAVLCHELLHVQRRDWMWLLIEEVIRTAFWFHPAMWLLIARVQQSREEVVDELVVMATGARRAYIEALATFAGAPSAAPASAFSQRRQLFRRILLLSRSRTMSSRRVTIACAVIAAAILAGSRSATSAFPLLEPATVSAESNEREGAPPIRPVDVALPRAATGTAVTPAHVPVVVAPIPARRSVPAVEPLPTPTQPPVVIGGAVAGSEAGRTPAAAVEDHGVLPPAQLPEPPPTPIRVGGGITVPRKIRDVKPAYPAIARSAKVSGIVILELVVGADGRVDSAHILRSIPLLDQAALDAVYQWEFLPTYLNGIAVPLVMSVTVNFVAEG
jgi:TonB family protein